MLTKFGYFLPSEEHGPQQLVRQAQRAADAGVEEVWISDHYHPWVDDQGESPFVWSVIGAIASTTDLAVTTAVTVRRCGSIRRSSPRHQADFFEFYENTLRPELEQL